MTDSPPPPPSGSSGLPWGSPPQGSSAWSSGFPSPPPSDFGAPPQPPGWSPATQPERPSGLAVAALVLGIVAIPLFLIFLPAILAVIFGFIAASTIKKQPARQRLGMARAGWILGVISLVGAVVAWVALVIVFADTKQALDLEPGDCIEMDRDATTVRRVPVKECDEPHDAEVVGVVHLNSGRDRDYPGDAQAADEASSECVEQFEQYTGRRFDDPSWDVPLRVSSIVADESAWDSERGLSVCLAGSQSGTQLVSPLRD